MITDIIKKIRRLLGYMHAVRGQLIISIFAIALNNLITTWMIADLFGNGMQAITSKSVFDLWYSVLAAAPWLACVLALNFMAAYFAGVSTNRATAAMRRHLFDTLIHAPLEISHSTHSGTKLSLFTNDIPTAVDSVIVTLSALISALLVGIVAFIYVVSVHWIIAVASIAIGMFTYIYSIHFAKWLHHLAVRMQALLATQEGRMKDLLDGMIVSRLYNMEKQLEDGMQNASREFMETGIKWARLSGLLGALNNATSHFTERVLIFISGLYLVAGELSLPDLMRVSQMAGAIAGVFHISRLLVSVQRSLAGAERAFAILDKTDPELSGAIEKGEISAPIIRFSHVTFYYRTVQPIIRDLSFEIQEGEMVAIVGSSGSGKSTVLRLIQSLYRVEQGVVTVLGLSTNEWDSHALRKNLMYVPQESVLFPGTIAQNISIGRECAEPDRIKAAAIQADAHDFIMAMPNGYNTQVSEHGASLSGGQKQRIAIARAFFCDAPILLLDEATSAMDTESEAAVHSTLLKLKGKKTILTVSHRMSTVQLADRIIRI